MASLHRDAILKLVMLTRLNTFLIGFTLGAILFGSVAWWIYKDDRKTKADSAKETIDAIRLQEDRKVKDVMDGIDPDKLTDDQLLDLLERYAQEYRRWHEK